MALAGFLTGWSTQAIAFPNPEVQWQMDGMLAAYSCGGSSVEGRWLLAVGWPCWIPSCSGHVPAACSGETKVAVM